MSCVIPEYFAPSIPALESMDGLAQDIMQCSPTTGSFTKWSNLCPHLSGDECIEDRIIEAFKTLTKEYGGPRQFLQQRCNTEESLCAFHDALLLQLPPAEDIAYHCTQALCEVASEADLASTSPMAFHPTLFSFVRQSSLKGDPESAVCEKLCEQIMADGFITSGDEFLVAPLQGVGLPSIKSAFTSPGGASVVPFSIGYVKGSARMTTVLAIVAMCIDDGISVKEAFMQ